MQFLLFRNDQVFISFMADGIKRFRQVDSNQTRKSFRTNIVI